MALQMFRSQVLLALWEKFREHGLGIPFPQRDLHIKGGSEQSVTINRTSRSAPA